MADDADPSSSARDGSTPGPQDTLSKPEDTTGPSSSPSVKRSGSASGPSVRQPERASVPFTLDRVVRFLFTAVILAGVGWLLWYFAGLVLYLVVGGLLAYLLRPLVDRLQGLGLRRVPAIVVAFVVLLAVISVLVTSIVPFVGQQVQELSQLINLDAATSVAAYIGNRIRELVPLEAGVLERNVRQMGEALLQGDLVGGDRVAQTLSSAVSVLTNIVYAVIIIPFVTFFLLKDGMQLRRDLLHLVPNRYFEVTLAILDKVEMNIGRYFRGLLIQCTAIAIIASVLLWIVGLQSAIAIGIFTGVANTIPYFGPFLGFLCGTLVGIVQTGNMALVPGVAIAMALTQLADNVLLQPLIFSRAAQAHPLVILFVVLAGAQLAGIVGMLVAIPLTTILRVVGEQVLWSVRNYRTLSVG